MLRREVAPPRATRKEKAHQTDAPDSTSATSCETRPERGQQDSDLQVYLLGGHEVSYEPHSVDVLGKGWSKYQSTLVLSDVDGPRKEVRPG